VGDIHVVVGLLTNVASRVEVGVVGNTARLCSVRVLAIDEVVSIISVGRADWGTRWKHWLFRHGRRCFDCWKLLVLHRNADMKRALVLPGTGLNTTTLSFCTKLPAKLQLMNPPSPALVKVPESKT